jgi:hypothetical protein
MTKDTVEYTFTLYVTRAIRPDYDETVAEAGAYVISKDAQREIEKEILQTLRRLDGDCDIECLTAELKEND